MSAWIVSKQHIDMMVTAILARELSSKSPDELGRMLWAECLASVAYRYPHDKDGGRPGPVGFRDSDVTTYTWVPTELLDGGALAKTLGCYSYQSCEHPGWKDSESCQLVTKLKEALGDVPYPDDIPWGW